MKNIALIIGSMMAGGIIAVGGYMYFASAHPSANTPPAAEKEARNVLFWYDPMYPNTRFDKPGKSPFMDMDLVPKYADEESASAAAPGVRIDPTQTQNLGVKTEVVRRGPLTFAQTFPANVSYNEYQFVIMQARAAGFVDKVWPLTVGDKVKKGAPLLELTIDLHNFCKEVLIRVTRLWQALSDIMTRAEKEYQSLLNVKESDALVIAAKEYQRNMTDALRDGMKGVDDLSLILSALKFPAQWQGPQHLRDLLTLSLTNLKQAGTTFTATLNNASEQIAKLNEVKEQQAKLKELIPPVLTSLTAALSLLEDKKWQTIRETTTKLESVLATIDALQGNLLGNSKRTFFPQWQQECVAYRALAQKIKDETPINNELADFVAALEALNQTLIVPTFMSSSPFSTAFTDYWNREFIAITSVSNINSALTELSTGLDTVNQQATTLLSHNVGVVQAELARRKDEVIALIDGLSEAGQWVEVANKLQEQIAGTIDLFKFDNSAMGRFKTVLLTFLPPALLYLIFPNGFIYGIGGAGLCATIWAVIIPAVLALKARQKFPNKMFTVWGGVIIPTIVILFGVAVIVCWFGNVFNLLPRFS